MSGRGFGWAWMAAAATVGLPAPAHAVIGVELPVSKMVRTARSVAVGTVTKVTASNRVLDVKVARTLKGEPFGERMRVQIVSPAALIDRVAVGGRMVLFVGKARGGAVAALHLADTWLIARRIRTAKTLAWRVVQVHETGRMSFPGRTRALCAIVAEIQAGADPLLDKVEPKVFGGVWAKLADVPKGSGVLLAADVNGDGYDDVLAAGEAHVRLLLNRKGKLADATESAGLADAKGACGAFGDVDGNGRADLLLGSALYRNAGGRFTRSAAKLPLAAQPLAVALADADADGRADVLALTRDGRLNVLAGAGSPGGPWKQRPARSLWKHKTKCVAAAFSDQWGDDRALHAMVVTSGGVLCYPVAATGGEAADLVRLTGHPLSALRAKKAPPWQPRGAAALDLNADGRLDLLVAAEDGGAALFNRGYGAFFADARTAAPVQSHDGYRVPWSSISPGTLLAGADLHADRHDDLLVLTPGGELYELSNPPPKTGP